jgi:oligopeptide transport system substrate-binding protein
MWTLAATPQWVIEEHGDDWVEAGTIVTNGPCVLEEWIHNVRRSIIKNPLFPEDLFGSGNIERWVTDVVPDPTTGYALFLNNEVDYASSIPDPELQAFLEEFPDQAVQFSDLAVFYFGFNQGKAPFDNPDVRRAFSAAFDRETYINEVRQG